MPRYSAFTRYGMLAYARGQSEAEKIYRSHCASYIDPQTGVAAIDVSRGTYHETKLYARAMALAAANATVNRSANQRNSLKATESIPFSERKYRLAPGPSDTLESRRKAVASREALPRGTRKEALYEQLTAILGANLITIRPIRVAESTSWPTSPGDGPGLFTPADQPIKLVRLIDPVVVTGVASSVRYENFVASDAVALLAVGDRVCIQPENLGLCELVTVTEAAGDDEDRTFSATFENVHDPNVAASTGSMPIWWSTTGHLLIVVKHTAAVDAALIARVDEIMNRVAKAGSTWSVVEPTTPGAISIGPFTLDLSPLGAVTVGEIAINPIEAPFFGPVPAKAHIGGNSEVSLYGQNLTDVSDVKIDGVSVAFTFIDDSHLKCLTLAHAAGPVEIEVTTSGGIATAPFHFAEPPLSVKWLSPTSGPLAGGTTVTIRGAGFFGVSDVTIDGVAISNPWVVIDDETLTCITDNPGAPGLHIITLTNGITAINLPFTFV